MVPSANRFPCELAACIEVLRQQFRFSHYTAEARRGTQTRAESPVNHGRQSRTLTAATSMPSWRPRSQFLDPAQVTSPAVWAQGRICARQTGQPGLPALPGERFGRLSRSCDGEELAAPRQSLLRRPA